MNNKSITAIIRKKIFQRKWVLLIALIVMALLILLGTEIWRRSNSAAVGDNLLRLSEEEAQVFQEVLAIYKEKDYPKDEDGIPVIHHGDQAWFLQHVGETPKAEVTDAIALLHFIRERNAKSEADTSEYGIPNIHNSRFAFYATDKELIEQATPYMIELATYDGPLTRAQAEALFIYFLGSSQKENDLKLVKD